MKFGEMDMQEKWSYENGFYWSSCPTRINKLLVHYELYKSIKNIPGHIFELGVYKGTSLIRFATFRDAVENSFSRKIIGFDTFGKFPTKDVTLEEDISFIEKFEKEGGDGLSDIELESIMKSKNFQNIQLVKGNVFDTIPRYLSENPETRLSILHLDMDVKEPTKFALDILYDRIVPGGLIILDDYNAVSGATLSVDAFLNKHHLKIQKLPFYHVPSYIRKPV